MTTKEQATTTATADPSTCASRGAQADTFLAGWLSGGLFGEGAAAGDAFADFDEGFDADEAAVDAGDVVGEAVDFFVEALDVLGGQEDLLGGAHEVVGEAHWLFRYSWGLSWR
jgi:hypothetical protein